MSKNLYNLSSYHYTFNESQIAKFPANPRDSSRLMVVDRKSGNIYDHQFKEISNFLSAGDALIFNDTKVIPARLQGKRESGGSAEVFLIKNIEKEIWRVLVKPGKKLKTGSKVFFGDDFSCQVLETNEDGSKIVRFHSSGEFTEKLNTYGSIPLPQYMNRDADKNLDSHSYQTVFAKTPGAVAAPTAGLHFTQNLLNELSKNAIEQIHLTLHVGLGTFQPVREDDIRNHKMHQETCMINKQTAEHLNQKKGKNRLVCVGTTCCRTLESAAHQNGTIIDGNFETDIFIYPGYQFKFVDCLLTNFHLPESTLLMLVSAFAGYELTMEAYKKAVKDGYRLFSYGDAMLIL